ncbi:MAG: hypothetical protein JXA23_09745, partial [Bacteroidales bacterium]|nr:hypothetical protein [Bacteroidales bacterium]
RTGPVVQRSCGSSLHGFAGLISWDKGIKLSQNEEVFDIFLSVWQRDRMSGIHSVARCADVLMKK